MKIASWNVNGIRSVFKTTFLDFVKKENPDILCIQEIKARHDELSDEYINIEGYHSYFNSSKLKKGHSGVAIFTKIKPLSAETVLGIKRFDDEGRCIKLTFKNFVLYNLYIPHGRRDKEDIPYKLEVYKKLIGILEKETNKNIILVGDFNIAHTELDVFNAKTNKNNTMFTSDERNVIGKIISIGFMDVFRNKYPEKKSYTWWPYAGNLRERDIGWRIDYFFVTESLKSKIKDVCMKKEILGSDHCAICMDLVI